ncbi:hypothetical protein [Stenotrophomonas phage StenR_269]|nr:hypothetical protein [Stenotrophomonas phage StenR_269]
MDVTKLLLGINWKLWLIKVGIVLAFAAGISYISYEKGQASVRIAVAEEATKAAEIKTVIMMETIEKRVPVIQYIERDNAKLQAEVTTVKRNLDEAIKAAGDKPECSLSDAERMQFNEAARAIQRAATLPELGGS